MPEELPEPPPETGAMNLVAATESLFLEIADGLGNAAARDSLLFINAQMRVIRPHEERLLSGREAEFEALADCWRRRDLKTLHTLITAYFDRRQALLPQITRLLNESGPFPRPSL